LGKIQNRRISFPFYAIKLTCFNDKKKGLLTVFSPSKESEDIYVGFQQGPDAIYQGDALLRLKNDNKELLNGLIRDGSSMPLDDFKALYKINILQDRGTGSAIWQALEIARDNPAVWPQTLEPVGTGREVALEKTMAR
jgi:hypothetical protein